MARAFWAAFVGFILLSSVAARVAAGPLEDATAAIERRAYATALRFLRPLAAQGNADTQAVLGDMYFKGQGVARDYAEAAQWFRKAADQGNAEAQMKLGFMYVTGEGIARDDVEAVKWFHLAADKGQANAQCFLGLMYFEGRGVSRDYVSAHMWLNLAVAGGIEDAAKYRDALTAKMTFIQIEEAQRFARDWKPRQK